MQNEQENREMELYERKCVKEKCEAEESIKKFRKISGEMNKCEGIRKYLTKE
jgi:hypothetical protein